MKEYTFYLSIVLAAIQSLAMGIGFYRGGYLASKNALGLVIVVVALVTGACVLIYLGEEITKHGVGNGVSMILLFNIISRLPQDFKTLYDTFMSGKNIVKAGLALINYCCCYSVHVCLCCLSSGRLYQDSCTELIKGSGQTQRGKRWRLYSFQSEFSKRYSCYLCRFINVTAESGHNICW